MSIHPTRDINGRLTNAAAFANMAHALEEPIQIKGFAAAYDRKFNLGACNSLAPSYTHWADVRHRAHSPAELHLALARVWASLWTNVEYEISRARGCGATAAFFGLRMGIGVDRHLTRFDQDSQQVAPASIRTSMITLSVYLISGFLAALGGILLVARLWSAQPNAAVGLELDAIAAPVLGGVGGVPGTIAGAFILGILSNGLNLMGVPSFYQQVIKGVVLILAVMLDLLTKRRR